MGSLGSFRRIKQQMTGAFPEPSCVLRTLKLVLAVSLIVLGLIFAGSLLAGTQALNATYSTISSGDMRKSKGWLPNIVALSFRSESIAIPVEGMNICPLEYSELIPCQDEAYVRTISRNLNISRKEHLERHCPPPNSRLFCLIPPPKDYKLPIKWPKSRDFIWRSNVNHTLLAEVKGGQNWVHASGSRMWFPGGGTHFKHGASQYIQRLGDIITNGTGDLRTAGVVQVLDVGCGVASFAAYLLPLQIQTMSFAPIDSHENQIQFALERGIAAMVGVLGTTRMPYPSNAFELVHCSRCRVDWHENDGILLKEVDRVLRSNGYFVYSAPPAYKKDKDFPDIWAKLTKLTSSLCWVLIGKKVQTAVWRKVGNASCSASMTAPHTNFCDRIDDLDTSWNRSLQDCIGLQRSIQLPLWPARLMKYPARLKLQGVSAAEFEMDTTFWRDQVNRYWQLLQVPENAIRNVMDMSAIYGSFAAALWEKPLWVMNVVPSELRNTLPAVYDRGLIGTYHNWCEPFSTYPRSYDLLHAYKLFSSYQKHGQGCHLADILLEMDRLLRPKGSVLIVDYPDIVKEAYRLAPKFLWNAEVHTLYSDGKALREQLLLCQKKFWIVE
ncbi:hypothetical protein O6H91_19G039400 [Diphasiastrum complanatum]|uniref:Uncharacterized protein n=4 Tax=Diphasiastrum complanatum TaxID=34168 RepID=A0ACC2AUC6_DIPCM|nr:hypothetical protein O6H91_19G039400 [Diphasiastrum complanatum]KAJ7521134.1 hypothetical protein O6H91_19G039400 [Diphasiastrum complanatum]KAJ7521135.1 hypothetical protein O6H91_19G039400 [Diphasiastrum complanatum]KAJ7521136.1 hypothetical protein O6H91_19G039400 [Diphasiastrum complanatum]